MRLIQVAVPVPQLDALTYSVPPEFADPVVGARVLVPLGKRTLTGVVVSSSDSQLATSDSQGATRGSRLATSDSQGATRISRLATRSSRLATRGEQLASRR